MEKIDGLVCGGVSMNKNSKYSMLFTVENIIKCSENLSRLRYTRSFKISIY